MLDALRAAGIRRKARLCAALSIACFGTLFTTTSAAQIYRCTVDGRAVYSDRPCDAKSAAAQVRKADPRTSWDPAKHGGETYDAHIKSKAQGDLVECIANEYNAWYRAHKPRRPSMREREDRMATVRADCRKRYPAGIIVKPPPPRQASAELDAFRSAIESRNVAKVRAMLDAGIEPDVAFTGPTRAGGKFHTPALFFAIYNSSDDVSRLLVDRGAAISIVTRRGDTPLHAAADARHLKTIQALVRRGADLAARDSIGYTPLHMAVHGLNLEVVKYLVANGAPVNARADSTGTPLTDAIRGNANNERLAMIVYLLDSGADPNIPGRYGDYPLHMAVTGRSNRPMIEVIQALLKAGAKLDARNKRGETPLALAQRLGRTEVEALLRQ